MPRGTQIINGTEYVFETDPKWNAEKKYGTHTRTYIGKMVNGVFVPSKRYQLQCALEHAQASRPGPVPITTCSRRFCGATALFDGIGAKLGITDDLKACFPQSWKQMLSIAYFLILEDRNPLSRFPRWAASHRHPFGKTIPSQRSSELFGSIEEDAKQHFFRLQARRRMETEYLAYDTTSISSYCTMIKQVRYGRNKDHEQLPQINLALVYGESSQLPVYYRKLPGNINDVSTVKRLLADLAFLSFDKVKLVMDRGFYSEDTINALFQQHSKFLIAAQKSLRLVNVVLDEVRDQMRTRAHYQSNFKLYTYSRTVNWAYRETKKRSGVVETGERRLYLHLYYNDQKALDDRAAFNALLDTLEAELRAGSRNPEHEKLYQRYYEVAETPVRGVTLTPRQETIDEVEKNYGYFALLSNDIKDPIKALVIYRSKDLIEKAFGNLKERLNMRRTSVSSEENLEGKLFVQFVALMYLSYINKVMNEQGLYKHYTLHELLDELDVIECFEQPGHTAGIGEITQKQKNLYSAFGVAVPS
ncbi:MAG: IS1634 family transposase [Rectinema subterraneum]|uniref:IS1634 family transposase n=1 Tax=Rectinema subterraneum TaxID=2653714 RepID=UPI003C7DD27A